MEDTKIFIKEDTQCIKGFAICMMLMHHLYEFPEKLSIQLEALLPFNICLPFYFGNLCIAIFAVLSGYGFYYKGLNKENIKNATIKVYKQYVKVFLIFTTIGFLFFSKQPLYCEYNVVCSVFSDFNIRNYVLNLLALKSTYVFEWWYIHSYLYEIILSLIVLGTIKNKYCRVIIGICYFVIIDYWLLYFGIQIDFVPVYFYTGMFIAKHNIFNRLLGYKYVNSVTCFVGLIIFTLIRLNNGALYDFIVAPIYIVGLTYFIKKNKYVTAILLKLGKESMNMWLVHPVYIYYYYSVSKLILGFRNKIVVFLVLLLLSYITSLVINSINWNNLKIIKKKILRNI